MKRLFLRTILIPSSLQTAMETTSTIPPPDLADDHKCPPVWGIGEGEEHPLLRNKETAPTSPKQQKNGNGTCWSFEFFPLTDDDDNDPPPSSSNGTMHMNSFLPSFMTMSHRSASSSTRYSRRQMADLLTPQFRRDRYERRKQTFACWLAAFSGFADVLCSHSFGCYGNMMTGNTIRLMDHLAAGKWSMALYPASLVPSYILGAALCTWLNHLDLTILGLGGPSQDAFAHLNPPRRLRSPQQISILRVVSIVSAMFFLLGELILGCFFSSEQQQWRLPFFACAFGLINAATLNAVHIVTNAVTGHWITVGLGVADDLPVVLDRQSSLPPSDETLVPPTAQPPQPPKKWKSSGGVATSFICSIIVTSIVYNEFLRQIEQKVESWYGYPRVCHLWD